MKCALLAAVAAVSVSVRLMANVTVNAGDDLDFTGPDQGPGDTAHVEGWLKINAGNFLPDSLTIVGDPNPFNGLVDVNGGSFGPTLIDIQSGGRLNLNIGGSATTTTNDGTIRAATGPFSIGALNNIGGLHGTTNGATVNISSYSGTGGESVAGLGTINITSYATGVGAISPGDLDVAAPGVGNLTLASPQDLTMTLLTINIADLGSLTADKLIVDGSVTLGSSLLIVNGAGDATPVIDADGELVSGSEFVILDSTDALIDTFAFADGEGLTVRNGLDEEIGHFTVDYRAAQGQVVLVYQPVPEPASLAVVGIVAGLLLRRRRG